MDLRPDQCTSREKHGKKVYSPVARAANVRGNAIKALKGRKQKGAYRSLISVVVVLNCRANGKMDAIPSDEVKSGTNAAAQYSATVLMIS